MDRKGEKQGMELSLVEILGRWRGYIQGFGFSIWRVFGLKFQKSRRKRIKVNIHNQKIFASRS